MAFDDRGVAPGVSFSPIPGEKTLEDLPALLARLFGGPSEGTGVRRLPGLTARGVLPDEILRMFLAQQPGAGVQRPDITELLPTRPEVPAPTPEVPSLPGPTPPGPAPTGPVSPPPPPPSLEDVFAPQEPAVTEPPTPDQPSPDQPATGPGVGAPTDQRTFEEIFGAPESSIEAPGPGSSPEIPTAPEAGQGPTRGAPFSGGQYAGDQISDVEYTNESGNAGAGGGNMSPEEKAFMEMLMGDGGFSIR